MAAPRKYPPELKERALRLWRSEQPRRPIANVARELGIHPEAMRTWIRQDQADRGERTDLNCPGSDGGLGGWTYATSLGVAS